MMKCTETGIEGVVVIETEEHRDERGAFSEWFNRRELARELGKDFECAQVNFAFSSEIAVLRGLHYQEPDAQAKIVCVISGSIYDVAVDIRPDSKTFGKHFSTELFAGEGKMLFIDRGFAHGYETLSEKTRVLYLTDGYRVPEHERVIAWDDPDLGIVWSAKYPRLSDKDRNGAPFKTLFL